MDNVQLRDWIVPFGPYDCMLNGILLLMDHFQCDHRYLIRHNWDFDVIPEYCVCTGSATKESIFALMSDLYNCETTIIDLNNIRDDKFSLVALNAMDLPYIDREVNYNQVHYVLAGRVNDTQIRIWDAYFKTDMIMDFDNLLQSYLYYQRPVIQLEQKFESPKWKMDYIVPSIAGYGIEHRYKKANLLEELLQQLDETPNPVLFRRLLGHIRGLSLCRKQYFNTIPEKFFAEERVKIISGWNRVVMNAFNHFINAQKNMEKITGSIRAVIEAETNYLRKHYG